MYFQQHRFASYFLLLTKHVDHVMIKVGSAASAATVVCKFPKVIPKNKVVQVCSSNTTTCLSSHPKQTVLQVVSQYFHGKLQVTQLF